MVERIGGLEAWKTAAAFVMDMTTKCQALKTNEAKTEEESMSGHG